VQKITRGPTPQVPAQFSQELRTLNCDLLHRDLNHRPSAAEILQRPIVQCEIRRMLREEQMKGAAARGEELQSGVVNRRVSGPTRSRSVSVQKKPSIESDDAGPLMSARNHVCESPSALNRAGAMCMEAGMRSPARALSREPHGMHGGHGGWPIPAGVPSRHSTPASYRRH